jgi:hypothetical protein
MLFLNSKNDKYTLFNGLPCNIVNNSRDDGYIEIFIPAVEIYILVQNNEIESDD